MLLKTTGWMISWIKEFNNSNGKYNRHRFGVKEGRRFDKFGKQVKFKIHQLSQWRQTELLEDKIHLSDRWRVRLGTAVVRHFEGELGRYGVLA